MEQTDIFQIYLYKDQISALEAVFINPDWGLDDENDIIEDEHVKVVRLILSILNQNVFTISDAKYVILLSAITKKAPEEMTNWLEIRTTVNGVLSKLSEAFENKTLTLVEALPDNSHDNSTENDVDTSLMLSNANTSYSLEDHEDDDDFEFLQQESGLDLSASDSERAKHERLRSVIKATFNKTYITLIAHIDGEDIPCGIVDGRTIMKLSDIHDLQLLDEDVVLVRNISDWIQLPKLAKEIGDSPTVPVLTTTPLLVHNNEAMLSEGKVLVNKYMSRGWFEGFDASSNELFLDLKRLSQFPPTVIADLSGMARGMVDTKRIYVDDESTVSDLILSPIIGIKGKTVVEHCRVQNARIKLKDEQFQKLRKCNYLLHPYLHAVQLGNLMGLLLPAIYDVKVSPRDIVLNMADAEKLWNFLGIDNASAVLYSLLALREVAPNFDGLVTLVAYVSQQLQALFSGEVSKLKVVDLIAVAMSPPAKMPSTILQGTHTARVCEILSNKVNNKSFVWITSDALRRIIVENQICVDKAFPQVTANGAHLNSKIPIFNFSRMKYGDYNASLKDTFAEVITNTIKLVDKKSVATKSFQKKPDEVEDEKKTDSKPQYKWKKQQQKKSSQDVTEEKVIKSSSVPDDDKVKTTKKTSEKKTIFVMNDDLLDTNRPIRDIFTYDEVSEAGNPKLCKMLLDTGATISASPKSAIPLSLLDRIVSDDKGIHFSTAGGPSMANQYIDRLIATIWNNPVVIRFWIVDSLDLPLIGYGDQKKLNVELLLPTPYPSEESESWDLDVECEEAIGDVPISEPGVREALLSNIQVALDNNEKMKEGNEPCSHPLAVYRANFLDDVSFDKLQSPDRAVPRKHQMIIEGNKEAEIARGWLKEVPDDVHLELETEARFIVAGKADKPRVCFNAVTFNSCLKKVNPHIPRLDYQLAKIKKGENWIMTKLDMSKAYFTCPWAEDQFGLLYTYYKGKKYAYTRTPFGLSDLPNHFCRLMSSIFGKIEGVSVYFDDILCYSKNLEDHIKLVNKVLETCTLWNLPINVGKCRFGYQSVEYLGVCLSRKGISPSPSKIEGILEMDIPQTLKGISRFLGIVNFNRRFIPNITELITPLIDIQTNNKGKYKIDSVFKQTFKKAVENIKEAVSKCITLSLIPENADLAIYTDASEVGIGAVLGYYTDKNIDTFTPIATLSKKLKDYEVRWTTPRKELFAVVKAVVRWEEFLLGREFIIFTDHKALTHQLTALDKIPRVLQVWANILSKFSFKVLHVDGDENVFADKLSRAGEREIDNGVLQLHVMNVWKDVEDDTFDGASSVVQSIQEETSVIPQNYCPDELEFIKFWTPALRSSKVDYDTANESYIPVEEDSFDCIQKLMYSILPDWPVKGDSSPDIGFDSMKFRNSARHKLVDVAEVNLPTFGKYSDDFTKIIENCIQNYRNQLSVGAIKDLQSNLLLMEQEDVELNQEMSHEKIKIDKKKRKNLKAKCKLNDKQKQLIQNDDKDAQLAYLKHLHNLSHEGATRLVERAKAYSVSWPSMLQDAYQICGSCVNCLVVNYNKRMFLKSTSVRATCPFDCV